MQVGGGGQVMGNGRYTAVTARHEGLAGIGMFNPHFHWKRSLLSCDVKVLTYSAEYNPLQCKMYFRDWQRVLSFSVVVLFVHCKHTGFLN